MSRGFVVFVLLGLVSLFADLTYEGARGVVGPYLEFLEAGLVVAAAVSVGDLVAYVARLFGGLLAYRVGSSGAYWGLVFLGYTINLVAVPLLAFAGRWEEAFLLVLLERAGKGLRAPARDAILAEVSGGLGRGVVYAVHEAMDQVGAIAGPLLVMAALSSGFGYSGVFALLGIPALISLLLLTLAYILYPSLKSAEKPPGGYPPLERVAPLAIAAGLSMAGFIHWIHASFRYSVQGVDASLIAGAYAVAMLVDALAALALGVAYDKVTRGVVALVPIVAAASSLAALLGAPLALAAILWGVAMGGFQSVFRSVVADSLEPRLRGLGFGVVYFAMGLGWSVGNIAMASLPVWAGAAVALLAGGGGAVAMLGLAKKQGG
ncbi:conserved hypothetical protein [Aeropyrum pernix]|uniref:Major facilitator superfamily (MFS) profile domain-containing protein n=1 Tax=Aeropyrum pernix TaxID=56636 RepID=A0A401HC66_AERPX|nr:MFS transporter [Aeropyrum pernix]GBF09939.1 conserved hypothetical protein [Aeropyrum pernix]